MESPGAWRASPGAIAVGLARIAVVCTLAGCGQPSREGSSHPAASPNTSGVPTAGPTATPPPTVTKRFQFGPDVVMSTAIAGTDDIYINPGAVIEADGVLHMFPNVFSTWPGRVRVPHLTSDDGLTWTLDEDAAALDSQDVDVANPGIDVSTGYVADDGTWVLIFETVATSAPWAIWRATAPSPGGPWTVGPEAIVKPGVAGTFDAGGTQWPSVVRVGDRWALFYAGFDIAQGGTGSIGVAFSDDGTTWDKRDEPVITATERWEGRSVDRPRVVATQGRLVMIYAGRDLTDRGLATSPDGITWIKVPGPNIEQADFPIAARAWDSAMVYRGGQLEYFLEIGASTTSVYRATLPWP